MKKREARLKPRYSVGQISFGYLLGDYSVIAKMIPKLEINWSHPMKWHLKFFETPDPLVRNIHINDSDSLKALQNDRYLRWYHIES